MPRAPDSKAASARRARADLVRARSGPTWIALAPLLVATAVGCGATDRVGEETASTAEPIYGGSLDDDANANPAVVAVKVGTGSPFELCTGTLVGYNVVLTARHCISQQIASTVSCDQNGNSTSGTQLGADVALSTVFVYTGATPSLLGPASAGVTAMFHGTGDAVCNADVALLVLDTKITGIAPLRVRLVAPTNANESVRAVGYGQNDQSLPIGTRMRKDALPILAVGSEVSTFGTPLGSSEFELGLSICVGDSGGPAISETTGAIVGVVSRGGSCTDTFGHVYDETAPFASLFQQAFAAAGGSVAEEQGPAPTALPPPPGGTDAGAGPGVDSGMSPTMMNPDQVDPTMGPVNLRSGAGSGCTVARGGPSWGNGAGSWAGGWIGGLLLLMGRRRRTRSARPGC